MIVSAHPGWDLGLLLRVCSTLVHTSNSSGHFCGVERHSSNVVCVHYTYVVAHSMGP